MDKPRSHRQEGKENRITVEHPKVRYERSQVRQCSLLNSRKLNEVGHQRKKEKLLTASESKKGRKTGLRSWS